MIVNKYRTELNQDRLNILVKEESAEYNAFECIDSTEAAVDVVNSLYNLHNRAEEYVYLLALDTKHKILGVFEVSHGTVCQSMMSPREIFLRALHCGASSIMLLHNHPSGDTTPSRTDIDATDRMYKAGNLLGIALLDHIIVGNGHFSFRSEGYIL